MPQRPQSLKLAFVDDHPLFRKGLRSLIESIGPEMKILFEAGDGLQMQEYLQPANLPDIMILDINMPKMDGFEVVSWLARTYPDIRVLVMSMIEKEESVVRMLKLGVKGYLCKDVEPQELKQALYAILDKGFYYTDFVTGKLVHSLQHGTDESPGQALVRQLSERELNFLKLACSEFTYNEIAARMFLSPKTIDSYRDSLFEKLNVRSRVGLALFAVKHGLVKL